MTKQGLIFLNLLNISPKKIYDIISALGDPQRIFAETESSLRRIPSLTAKNIAQITNLRKSKVLDKELLLIEKEKIDIIDIFDESYPPLLKEISYPPPVLYLKGEKSVFKKPLFAIVGTRTPTLYGISTAARFSYELSASGLVIVSGLARGIDTVAHKQAIKVNGTIAVLGSGLLNIYPRENKRLAKKITETGAVISEFPLNTPPLRHNFPRRNRIVSGLCCGVLVVEAAGRSGALITARLACEQNREVFAVPGKTDSFLSKGTHLLIKEGACLTESIDDILDELNIRPVSQKMCYNRNLTSQKCESQLTAI
ncbi:MAG: DNA-processing protein DprA [Candidatus Omnitrophota bacterium]|nr:MAG: DNA-processing protein DprA [Candidatus Omnitrophota bacterium]